MQRQIKCFLVFVALCSTANATLVVTSSNVTMTAGSTSAGNPINLFDSGAGAGTAGSSTTNHTVAGGRFILKIAPITGVGTVSFSGTDPTPLGGGPSATALSPAGGVFVATPDFSGPPFSIGSPNPNLNGGVLDYQFLGNPTLIVGSQQVGNLSYSASGGAVGDFGLYLVQDTALTPETLAFNSTSNWDGFLPNDPNGLSDSNMAFSDMTFSSLAGMPGMNGALLGTITVVPEPSSLALMGLLGLLFGGKSLLGWWKSKKDAA